jgi:phage tail protein X
MVRSASAAAVLAMIVLPSVAQAQTPQTHRVVAGETLWSLAQRYYTDPYRWPRIYEANRGVVEDPHWIYPGEELVIPDVTATETVVQQVTVSPAPAPAAAPAAPPQPVEAVEPDRTIFYSNTAGQGFGLIATAEQNRLAVPRSIAYAAPWLGPLDRDPDHLGQVMEFAGAEDEHVPRTTALPFDRLELAFSGPVPARGTELLAFRVDREIDGLGQVLIPTGVLAVSDPVPGGAVALVVDAFDRLSMGDLVIALPTFTLQPGARPQPTTTGADATLVAVAVDHALQEMHDIAFLDQGSDHGVQVGDEYVWNEGTGTPPEVEGRLQVISTHPDHSSARIVWIRNPIFQTGVRVRIDRRMP